MPNVGGPFIIDMKGCARCGGEHVALSFSALKRPMRVECGQRDWEEFTHWATCPITKEPILAHMMGVTTR